MKININLKDIIPMFDNPEVIGDENVILHSVASLEKAGEGDLTFLSNEKYTSEVPATKASVVLLPRNYAGSLPEGATVVKVDNPSVELAKLCGIAEKAMWPAPAPQTHPSAVIAPTAKIGKNCFIGANVIVCDGAEIGDNCVFLGNNYVGRHVKIGNDCFVMPNAVVMDYCELGKRVRLQPGVVVGSDGFGYVFMNGKHEKVPQVGRVVLCDDVEIGANTCIDRARFDKTIVGEGSKVDNLVQIAHNVEIGKCALLVSQVGVSGSTHVGNYCILGGQVGVAGHLKIGDGAKIGGQSGVNGNIPENAVVRGAPARPYFRAHKIEAILNHLPEILERLKDVEAKLGFKKKLGDK